MFERYTEKARRVIFFARYYASEFGSSHIDTEHLLLGILKEDRTLASRLVHKFGESKSIRDEIADRIERGERIATTVEIPLSQQSKQALIYAAEEADQLGHERIGSEHLLLGLLRTENTRAAQILREHEIDMSAVRGILGEAGTEGAPGSERNLALVIVPFQVALERVMAAWKAKDVPTLAQCFRENGHLWNLDGEISVGRAKIEEELRRFLGLIELYAEPHVIDTMPLRGVMLSILEWKPAVATANAQQAAFRILLLMERPASLVVSAHLIRLTPGPDLSQ
ncbi:MAG TPA: Clp protease N-terminal domain-containing protein [Candidatus Aquilonibacter sp.]|nr:Clp protease N-terminal domain-containing protein [Candidatus Aquilonibacter sp.]